MKLIKLVDYRLTVVIYFILVACVGTKKTVCIVIRRLLHCGREAKLSTSILCYTFLHANGPWRYSVFWSNDYTALASSIVISSSSLFLNALHAPGIPTLQQRCNVPLYLVLAPSSRLAHSPVLSRRMYLLIYEYLLNHHNNVGCGMEQNLLKTIF